MEINEDIFKEAQDIISAKNKAREYQRTCMAAMICPVCGETLSLTYKFPKFEYLAISPLAKYACDHCDYSYSEIV